MRTRPIPTRSLRERLVSLPLRFLELAEKDPNRSAKSSQVPEPASGSGCCHRCWQ